MRVLLWYLNGAPRVGPYSTFSLSLFGVVGGEVKKKTEKSVVVGPQLDLETYTTRTRYSLNGCEVLVFGAGTGRW